MLNKNMIHHLCLNGDLVSIRKFMILSVDLSISGDNSITICNTRSIILLVDMRQPGVGVVIEGDVDYLLGLGPLLVGGVSCLLDRQRTLPNNSGF